LGYFVVIFLIDYFFLTSSFNIDLIENLASYFFFISYGVITVSWPELIKNLTSYLWQVNLGWLRIYFFNWFFFYLILQYILGWLRIVLHIYFLFVFMKLSRFHDPCQRLAWLPRVFFFSQFHHLILSWLWIRLHNLFWFALYEVIFA